jgi:hypothetical protein
MRIICKSYLDPISQSMQKTRRGEVKTRKTTETTPNVVFEAKCSEKIAEVPQIKEAGLAAVTVSVSGFWLQLLHPQDFLEFFLFERRASAVCVDFFDPIQDRCNLFIRGFIA